MQKRKDSPAEISEKQELITSLFWNNNLELIRMAQPLINKYVIQKTRQEVEKQINKEKEKTEVL